MTDGFLKVAAAIPRVRVADIAYNTQEIESLVVRAEGQGVEEEPIGDVVVGGDGLRVAVDHDGLVAIGQGHRGVNTGVVELNALADPVRTRAQDDDGLTLAGCHLGLQVVAGVEVGGA